MCNCIEELNKTLREEYNDPEAKIKVNYSFTNNLFIVLPTGLLFQYRKRKKDNSFYDKKTSINITPTFCPFCGKKYLEIKETN